MIKSEKLQDFKTQEQKIQAVWNTGIYKHRNCNMLGKYEY